MKIFLTLCLSMFIVSNTMGQLFVNDIPIDTLNTPFCQLICENAEPLSKARILIDFGQSFVDNGINRQKFMDAAKKAITFNSNVDALNFMVRHGWELASFKMRGDKFIYLLQRKKRPN
ncbi:hypothetical protein IC229_21715 [Spirosoma sp. BT702]|uniref:Uncharacterized protein n=1 Tax=Spirosoma profusum TaxID=2771354 RepID=A0A926Y3C8_9BACT|nr:hypothetical protein [Spirosoma profusum]MBD2703278.1 hypothetical protein [Spirosoma profusum]